LAHGGKSKYHGNLTWNFHPKKCRNFCKFPWYFNNIVP
jgi:hypothetical protein